MDSSGVFTLHMQDEGSSAVLEPLAREDLLYCMGRAELELLRRREHSERRGRRSTVSGEALGGSSCTLMLSRDASSHDGAYNGWILAITGGTGRGLERVVASYAGATRCATIADWGVATAPGLGSSYELLPGNSSTLSGDGGEAERGHAVSAGRPGQSPKVSCLFRNLSLPVNPSRFCLADFYWLQPKASAGIYGTWGG